MWGVEAERETDRLVCVCVTRRIGRGGAGGCEREAVKGRRRGDGWVVLRGSE